MKHTYKVIPFERNQIIPDSRYGKNPIWLRRAGSWVVVRPSFNLINHSPYIHSNGYLSTAQKKSSDSLSVTITQGTHTYAGEAALNRVDANHTLLYLGTTRYTGASVCPCWYRYMFGTSVLLSYALKLRGPLWAPGYRIPLLMRERENKREPPMWWRSWRLNSEDLLEISRTAGPRSFSRLVYNVWWASARYGGPLAILGACCMRTYDRSPFGLGDAIMRFDWLAYGRYIQSIIG